MALLDEADRAVLNEADRELSGFQEALETAARSNALDRDILERLNVTAQQAAGRLNENLPIHIDADRRDEIRRRLLTLLTQGAHESLGPLDAADRALIEAEALRHIVRDLLDEQPPAELRDAGSVVALLEEWLPSLTVAQIAELLGRSVRQLQRRRQTGGASTARMQVVARLVAILRHSWTDEGVYAWFMRPRRDLEGVAPIELLDEPGCERDLVLTARAGRVQGGG